MNQAPASPCLSADVAAAYAAGKLTEHELLSLGEHIDECSTCRQLLSHAAELALSEHSRDASRTADVAPVPGATPKLSPGAVVSRYVIDAWLGAGGMGVVYAAHDPDLKRRVALKVLRERIVSDDRSAQDLLRREAMAMARLAHPNVVGVYDLFAAGNQLIVAMELVEGTTLREWLRAERRPWRDVLGALTLAGRGLAAAHAEGIVHRDFKPENVLIGAAGRVCVSDFGLSRMAEDPAPVGAPASGAGAGKVSTLARAGTPRYMSPEQRRGDRATDSSDQFSFCVALYEGVYGQHPYDRGSDERGEEEWRVRPVPIKASVPSWLRRCLLRGLSEKPQERYASMNELLVALGRDPTLRRRRISAVALAVAAIVAVSVGALHARNVSAQSRALLCSGSERQLAGVWDDARKGAIERAFAATHEPYAVDAWQGVQKTVDRYAGDWVAMRTQACEATRLRGEQSEQMLDLRMACLDDRLKDLAGLVDVLASADGPVVAHALAASQGLGRLASCSDAKALTSRVKLSSDPRVIAQVESLRERLAHVKAMEDAGMYREALPRSAEIADAAEKSGDPAAQGEALVVYGRLQGRTGNLVRSEETLRRAASVADSAGDDATRVRSFGALLRVLADAPDKGDEIGRVWEQATGATRRRGRDDDLQATVQYQYGIALVSCGRLDDARTTLEAALPLAERASGSDSLQVSTLLAGLAGTYTMMGAYDRAIDAGERALAIKESALGPAHPDVADLEDEVGCALAEQGRAADAEPHLRRALRISEAALGAAHPKVASHLDNLGQCLSDQHRFQEALSCHERALAIRDVGGDGGQPLLVDSLTGIGRAYLGLNEPAPALAYLERALKLPVTGRETDVAEVQFLLARALDATRGDLRRALALAAQARIVYAKSGRGSHDAEHLAVIDAWLAERSGKH